LWPVCHPPHGTPENGRGEGTKGRKGEREKGRKSKHSVRTLDSRPQASSLPVGERRQLTVMFCDLVGSTSLSTRLDPEELREVVQAYHELCATAIHRFGGYLAQYVGDGVVVYFGDPRAHEDVVQRAVRAGLEIVAELRALNERLQPCLRALREVPLQLRIGIHTGLAVVGEMGREKRRELLALGETPNLAARVQGIAAPDTVLISSATYQLSRGFFECLELGTQPLKGVSVAVPVYQVVRESGVQSRFEVALSKGLTPLVGREQEVGLLWERWEQVKEGRGQVAFVCGEPGIGKSRLVQELKERIAGEPHTALECRCSPYYQNSAFYPVIELLRRALGLKREEGPQEQVSKLERALARHPYPLHEVVPLFAALLALPLPEQYPPSRSHLTSSDRRPWRP
jgi:class 3 adenylate cyclase